MTVPITPLPPPPNSNNPANFDPLADAFNVALVTFGNEVNGVVASLNAALAATAADRAQTGQDRAQTGADRVQTALDRIATDLAAAITTVQAAAALAAKNSALNSAAAAQVYASQAQATNPDSPIRINPRFITADFAVGSRYNAASVGPITISDGVTVTVSDNATWSVH